MSNKIAENIMHLTLSQTVPGFYVSGVQVLKTQQEKEKLLIMSNFSFSHSVFFPLRDLSAIFIKFKIVICNDFQVGKSKICLLGKG